MTMPGGLLQQPDPNDPMARINAALQHGLIAPPGGMLPGRPTYAGAPAVAPPGQGTPMPPIGAQEQRPGFLARLFGGAVPPGLLSGQQQQAVGREGLLNAGLAILANSRGQRNGDAAPSVGQALAAGLQAGRESYATSAQNAAATTQAQRREQLLRTLGADTTPDQMRSLYIQALAAGDVQTANSLRGLMESDAAMNKDKWTPFNTADGTAVLINNRDGSIRPIGSEDNASTTIRPAFVQPALSIVKDFRDAVAPVAGALADAEKLAVQVGILRTPGNAQYGPNAIEAATQLLRLGNPGSIMRQASYDALQSAQGFMGQIQAIIAKAPNGNLPPAMVDALERAADGLAQVYRANYQQQYNAYQSTYTTAGASHHATVEQWRGLVGQPPVGSSGPNRRPLRIP